MQSGYRVHMQSTGGEQDMKQLKTTFVAYAVGHYYASACTSLTDDEATNCMGTQHPGAWQIADEAFADGRPNGGPCAEKPSSHRHVLFTR
jgi:hypothetical protein